MVRKTDRWIIPLLLLASLLIILLGGCERRATVTTVTSGTSSPTASAVSGDSIVAQPIATTGCGNPSAIVPGTSADETLTSGGVQRMYRLHVSTGYNPNQLYPVVLNIPGHTETALAQEQYSQYSALADQDHFLVVYPQGTIGPDGELGWATYGRNDPTTNDMLFFSDLLTALQQHWCVDARRIYVTGISNGGGMANLLACRMAGRIAAFAPVAAAIYPIPGGCHPARPVAYLEFHGTSDPLVFYNGSRLLQFLPIMQTLQNWATLDGCTSGPTIFFQQADVTGFEWSGCRGGVTVQHYRIEGGGHTWPGSPIPTLLGATTHTISATTLSWQFFQQAR